MRAFLVLLAAGFATGILSIAQTAQAHHPIAKIAKPAPVTATVPEMIFFDGVIYTGAGLAEDKPQVVQAIAIGGGKVLAVGTDAQITRLAGPNTHLHDLDTTSTSDFIFPGFNDAHTHLGGAGQTKINVDLTGVKSLAEMLAKI